LDGPPDHIAAIRQQFPGWNLWLSDTGRWWAFRKVELTAADVAAGCAPFLHADDPETLTRQISAQGARRQQPARPRLTHRGSADRASRSARSR